MSATEPDRELLLAVALDGRIRLRDVVNKLPWRIIQTNPASLTVQLEEGNVMHLFGIGAAVIEGIDVLEAGFARAIEDATERRVEPKTEETLTLQFDAAVTKPEVGWDFVRVEARTVEVLSATAHLMAQSVALERYEHGADQLVDEALALVRELSEHGRPPWRQGLPIRRVAKQAEQRLELARWFFPLDRPDWTWEDQMISEMYDRLSDNLELHERHDALQHKLASVQSTLEIVIDLWQSRRSRSLEWAIVVLIIAELVLALLGALH